MIYILCGLAGFSLAVFLYNFDDIKRKRKRKKIAKRYERLRRGIPKRVVHLSTWNDLFNHRYNPISINGKTFKICHYEWWHCNDERTKMLHDTAGIFAGYINITADRRCYDDKGKQYFIYSLRLSQSPSCFGKRIKVSAVVDVY